MPYIGLCSRGYFLFFCSCKLDINVFQAIACEIHIFINMSPKFRQRSHDSKWYQQFDTPLNINLFGETSFRDRQWHAYHSLSGANILFPYVKYHLQHIATITFHLAIWPNSTSYGTFLRYSQQMTHPKYFLPIFSPGLNVLLERNQQMRTKFINLFIAKNSTPCSGNR